MHEKIVSELSKIVQEEQVRILYACESGSRAWGFPSKDSDYDVRFIYIHPVDWYLSIDDKRDVIERPINDKLDISGWEIRKALRLLWKSNPPLLEWLQSPIVYWERYSVTTKIREASPLIFSPKSCMYHYLSMAKGNFREYLQGDSVRVKKYFYVLRPILACKWIEERDSMPPMEFDQLVEELIPKGKLFSEIHQLLQRKKSGDELDFEPKITLINEFLDEQILHFSEVAGSLDVSRTVDDSRLNNIFRDALKEVWD